MSRKEQTIHVVQGVTYNISVFFSRVYQYVKLLALQLINILNFIIKDSVTAIMTLIMNPAIQSFIFILLIAAALCILLNIIRDDGLGLAGSVLYIFTNTINTIISALRSVASGISSAASSITSAFGGGKSSFSVNIPSVNLNQVCYADLLRAMPKVCRGFTDGFFLAKVAWNVAHPTALCHLARFYQPSALSPLIDLIAPTSIYDLQSCSISRTAGFCFYSSLSYLGLLVCEVAWIIIFALILRKLISDIFLLLILIILDLEYLLFDSPTTLMHYVTLSSTRVSLLSPFSLKQRQYESILPIKHKD